MGLAMNILCAWEMGGGLGHLARLIPFIDVALEKGHHIAIVVKELENIDSIYGDREITLYQAPYDTTPRSQILPCSWPETLLLRYRSTERLRSYLRAWKSVFNAEEPDVVIYDAAPTAMIASLCGGWRKWAVGSPFFMPRVDLPLMGAFPLRVTVEKLQQRLRSSESRLLKLIHGALDSQERLALLDIRDIILQLDTELLTTIPEFDYYGARRRGEYVGMPSSPPSGAPLPAWPTGTRLKVFGYLKSFKGWEKLLQEMESENLPAIIYSRDANEPFRHQFKRHVFISAPADMVSVVAEADLVIHMAGSQTVARCMQNGVPQLMITTGLEQLLTAQAAERIGAGIQVSQSTESYIPKLRQAVELARNGKLSLHLERSDLLDGSYYERRARELISSLSGAVRETLADPTT